MGMVRKKKRSKKKRGGFLKEFVSNIANLGKQAVDAGKNAFGGETVKKNDIANTRHTTPTSQNYRQPATNTATINNRATTNAATTNTATTNNTSTPKPQVGGRT